MLQDRTVIIEEEPPAERTELSNLTPVYRHKQEGKRKLTRCTLIGRWGYPVASGIAVCSPKDRYNRKLGNMIAMNRAVKAYTEAKNLPVIMLSGEEFYKGIYMAEDKARALIDF